MKTLKQIFIEEGIIIGEGYSSEKRLFKAVKKWLQQKQQLTQILEHTEHYCKKCEIIKFIKELLEELEKNEM